MSAESIYDRMLSDIRKYKKLETFHGNGHRDIIDTNTKSKNAVSLDDFCREALLQGLEFHQSHSRGFLPAG